MDQIYTIEPLRDQLLTHLKRRKVVLSGNALFKLSTEDLASASGKPTWAVEAAMTNAEVAGLASRDDQGRWCLPTLETV